MAKLTIIVGMGGSGKTTFGEQFARSIGAKFFTDATLTNTEDCRAGIGCLGEMVATLLGRNQDCVMYESHLTVEGFRETFRRFCDEFLPAVVQEWIFFEADAVACINNVFADYHKPGEEARKGPDRLSAVLNQSRRYSVPGVGTYPGHRRAIPVHLQPRPQFAPEQEREAIVWLESEIAKYPKR